MLELKGALHPLGSTRHFKDKEAEIQRTLSLMTHYLYLS